MGTFYFRPLPQFPINPEERVEHRPGTRSMTTSDQFRPLSKDEQPHMPKEQVEHRPVTRSMTTSDQSRPLTKDEQERYIKHLICQYGKITHSFTESIPSSFRDEINPLLEKIFKKLGGTPQRYESEDDVFYLTNNLDITILTDRKNTVQSRDLGQLSKSDFVRRFKIPGETNNDIKDFIMENIETLVRTMWDNLLLGDRIVYFYRDEEDEDKWTFKIIRNTRCPFKMPIKRYGEEVINPFTLTENRSRPLELLVKYKDVEIALITINRKVKFSFLIKNIIPLIK